MTSVAYARGERFVRWVQLAPVIAHLQFALSLAPFVFSIAALATRSVQHLNVGDWERTLPAFGNSLLLAALVATLSVIIASALILLKDRVREAAIFSLLGLMLPGEFSALGMDRFLGIAIEATGWAWFKMAGFILALIGFVFPYVACSLLLARFSMSPCERLAIAELSKNDWYKARMVVTVRRRDLLLAWIVGVNLCASEVTRTRILGEDLIGIGSQFFGPLVVDAFQARGLEQVYFFLSYLMVLMIVIATVKLFRQSSTPREEAIGVV